jgi:hypothetical protein
MLELALITIRRITSHAINVVAAVIRVGFTFGL